MLDSKSRAWQIAGRVAARLLKPRPQRHADEWASQTRYFPDSAPFPGPWVPSRAPYVAPICEAIADPTVDQVTVVMGTQMSKTEGCQLNVMGWTLADAPCPMLYIGPTQSQVRKIAKPLSGRFDRMLAECEELRELIDPRANSQQSFERLIASVPVLFAWGGSDSEVASNPVKLVLVDEFDKMDSSVLENARSRTKFYSGRMLVVCSTPTVDGASNIQAQFNEGTRERWFWRCPDCREWFYPRGELLTWDRELVGLELRASAGVACPECGSIITEGQRDGLEHRFFPTKSLGTADDADVADERLDIAPALSHRSFAVSGLATPTMTVGEVAEVMARAEASGDHDRLREATNDFLGEPFRLRGDSPGWHAVWNLREHYEAPPGAQWCTIGADVAGNRIDYVVRAWAPGAESWELAEGELYGDTALDEVFLRLQALIAREWYGLPVVMALCDSGYNPASVGRAAAREPRLFPSKGRPAMAKRYYSQATGVSPTGQALKVGTKLWHINSHYWKGWVYGRIRWPAGEPGAWHVRHDASEDYCRQVTNEEMIEMPGGKVAWIETGSRQNHKLDCEALAAAAAYISGVESLVPLSDEPAPPPPPRRSPSKQFRRHGV